MFDILGYYEALSLAELFDIVKKNPAVKLVAGGTDVLVKTRDRDKDFVEATLVGITRIPELKGIEIAKDGTILIGAVSSFTTVENDPIVKKHLSTLAFAVSNVGGPQTRNAGTIGGNVCNGATSGDSGPTLFSYNAVLEIHSEDGIKDVKIADFYKGPGWVELNPGEVLVKIKIAKEDYEGYKGHYTKFAQRNAMDIANLSCATIIKEKGGIIEDIRIAYGVAGPTPIRATVAEEFAIGKKITDENLAAIGVKCLETAKARDSWRASKEYREHLIQILPGRNIRTALGGK